MANVKRNCHCFPRPYQGWAFILGKVEGEAPPEPGLPASTCHLF
jgi:hypothetical protein